MKPLAILAIAGTISLGLLAQSPPATAVEISGSGEWGVGTPVTTYSAPDQNFSFDFTVPSPTEANPSGLVGDFMYFLNGVNVAAANDTPFITFFDTANGGLFDLFFPTSGDDVTFEGPQIGFDASGSDTGGGPVTITDGSFAFAATANFPGATTAVGTLEVPEPSTMLLLSAGFVALRAARRRVSGKNSS
jgi:hypothetical protein